MTDYAKTVLNTYIKGSQARDEKSIGIWLPLTTLNLQCGAFMEWTTNGGMGLDLKTKSKWQSGKFIVRQTQNKLADGDF